MKKLLVLKLVLILALLLQGSLVYAQGEDLIKAETELDESIADLSEEEGEGESKSEEEIVAEELELLKKVTAFTAVLSFTKAEIEELSVKLEGLEYKFGDDLWDFYKAIRKHFVDSEAERSEFSARIVDFDSNLTDIKSLAAEFKEWREAGYDEKNKAFFDFALLARASDIIEVAEERASKIDKDLDKFEDEFGEVGTLQLKVLFAKAQLELGKAKDFKDGGNRLFETNFKDLFFPTEDALATEDSAASDDLAALEAQSDLEEELDISRELIVTVEGLIGRIQETYKIFIDMSELAEQLLREE